MEALQGVELTGTNRSCGLTAIISFFDRDSPFMRSSRLIATLKTLCKILHRQTLHACSVALRWKQFSGGLTGGATPDPISNSEVKTSRADGTAGETLWESRSPPGIIPSPEPTILIVGSGLFYCPGPRPRANAESTRRRSRSDRHGGRLGHGLGAPQDVSARHEPARLSGTSRERGLERFAIRATSGIGRS